MVKKKTSHNPPPTPGERLKAIRTFVQSIRKEFCKKTGISEHTLRSWEKNTVPLTRNGALRICELLATEGILCTPEWLLKGIGTPPLTQESIKRKFTQTFGEKEVEEDNGIAAEAHTFSLSCLNPMEAIEDPFFTDPKMKTAYEILWFRRKKTVFHK